jgi:hypothetical protein
MKEVVTIDRIDSLDLNRFRENYLRKRLPVVISNAAKNWQAFNHWTPESLQKKLSDKQVTIGPQRYKFSEFIDRILRSSDSEPAPYLVECGMTEQFPELLSEISPSFHYIKPNRFQNKLVPAVPGSKGARNGYPELLIGGRGSRFPFLHYDKFGIHAFITQIYGDKEFTLFAPEQTPYLYPMKGMGHISYVDNIDKPNLQRFPKFAAANPIRVIVQQGDTIFVPAKWWHVTKNLGPSIAISFNSLTSSNWADYCECYLAARPNDRSPYTAAYLRYLGKFLDCCGL